MIWRRETEMQRDFTRWLKGEGAGASALVHKISDSAIGYKPFDCVVLGAEPASWLGSREFSGAGFELKLGSRGRIGFSELLGGTRGAQLPALERCEGQASRGFYVCGFDRGARGARAYIVDVDDMREELRGRGAFAGRRGSVGEDFCAGVGWRVIG